METRTVFFPSLSSLWTYARDTLCVLQDRRKMTLLCRRADFSLKKGCVYLAAATHPLEKKSETKRLFGGRKAEKRLPVTSLEGDLRWDFVGETRKKPCGKTHGWK